MAKIKICGITNLEDALAAVALGADALGFVFYPGPHQVGPETVRHIMANIPPMVTTVGVFADQPLQYICMVRDYCGLDVVQLQGQEAEEDTTQLGRRVIKALDTQACAGPLESSYPDCALLLAPQCTSRDKEAQANRSWDMAKDLARKRILILSHGLDTGNVLEAIRKVNPFGVDASISLENEPGQKDRDKMAAFINQARAA
ncbi:MAG: phosphoribosylanthranilate isomerase [Desulfarculaceae bacterium]|jgi:phosphoribosylanthranilate isomerase